jgi:hypothetical protein
VQEPAHAPDTHAWLLHAVAVPHVPLELHVCTPLPEHCVAFGMQLPVHAPLTHAWLVQAAGLPHAPVGPQVWTPLPEHCVVPGVHATHPPFRQIGVVPEQATGVTHWPLAPHVSTAPPPPSVAAPPSAAEHCVAPGLQTPPHAPETHVYVHADALPHVPPAVHVSTPPLVHCVAPDEQDAAHAPLVQTPVHAVPVFCQVPVVSHVCGCCPLHCIVPGVQVPVHAPATHANGHVAPVLTQLPLVSHACGWAPLHCIPPCEHDPEQAPAMHIWPLHVEDVVCPRRSGPHVTTVVALLHAVPPGCAEAQSESIGSQRPWLGPVMVSQFSPAPHVCRSVHIPPPQMSATF